jgi:hypothetical protein
MSLNVGMTRSVISVDVMTPPMMARPSGARHQQDADESETMIPLKTSCGSAVWPPCVIE